MKKEYWKPVVGYEGHYQVSNFGRVKSIKFGKEIILKQRQCMNGYKLVTLYKDGKGKIILVHRLVAQAFIPNPDNLPEVNHKDENKTNNVVTNLEWCDRLYNVRYGTGIERQKKKQLNNIKKSKPVLQYDLEGNFIKEWKSISECGRNGFHIFCISSCCNGKQKTHKGFIWRYK